MNNKYLIDLINNYQAIVVNHPKIHTVLNIVYFLSIISRYIKILGFEQKEVFR